ncbi:Uncharacterized protein BP5553_03339 [Venustampulla echinocandica]|uniref:Uncharacterized protein n=1 Tax=Venustampulla echinocandica TaxID=2656787 RepID=A0A370TTZ9_9HELO|nr:Uncharacterized protein BP5553_03339 [Venustampulla echinocandica]RDL38999.1 Uncharacterized protein BP5553_03339 [Venustampulla echinocandica]
MHLAFPSRKSSNPPHYPIRYSRFPTLRRSRAKTIGIGILAAVVLIWVLARLVGSSDGIPPGTPPVVIVTVVDEENYPAGYIQTIKENRIEYAKKHGYATFFPTANDYDLKGAPRSWARVPAVRHAMSNSSSTYFWYLDQNSLIMNPDVDIETHIMNPKKLESMMIKGQPIVPPDSVIKTWPHLKGDQAQLVLTQDAEGLAAGSFIVRRGDWGKFFLDTWYDPLYRSYNFQKADTHALEHIVQWHPTILAKLALIPQRTIDAANKAYAPQGTGAYIEGDFVIRFAGCEQVGRDCVKEAGPFLKQWRTIFDSK